MQARVKKAKASTRVDTAQGPRNPYAVDAETYERARAAWLEHGTKQAVRDAIGCGLDLANRLVDVGEPSLRLPALRDVARVLAAELDRKVTSKERAVVHVEAAEMAKQLEARAAAAKAARAHETKVLGDAVSSRAEEVRLVRVNRQSALVLAGVNAALLKVSSRLASSLLQDEAALVKLPARERMGLLRTIAGVVHRTAQASQVAVHMEHLLMGKPTTILGRADAGPSTDDMTPEEAEQWLALANRAFARRAARRTVVDVEPDGADVQGAQDDEESLAELVEDVGP